MEDSPIKLGRIADCTIRIDDNSLSRYHCMLFYDTCQKITDGDEENGSTNGTWLSAENFFEIYDGMVFKVAETISK